MNIHQNLENEQWEHFSEKGEKFQPQGAPVPPLHQNHNNI